MTRRGCSSWRFLLLCLCCIYLTLSVPSNAMLEVGNPELFAYTRPSPAFHLEIDEADPAQLIAAYVSSLVEIRQNDTEPRKIVGGSTKGYQDGKGEDAKFKLITSFAQLNMTHIALVDHESHCLRMVDRPQQSATTLAGQCGRPGHIDGSLLSSKFYQPYNMIRANNNSLLVTDHNNNAIREVNLATGIVSTFLQSDELEFPIDIVLDEGSRRIFVTLMYKLVYIDSEKNVHQISNDRGDKIVMFSSNEMVISDNRRDFEKNGHKSRIKRLAILEDDTRGAPQFKVTVLLEWPIAYEPMFAIQLNKAEKKLYASERWVVRRANFRVDGDPMFTTTTTTSITTNAPPPSPSTITASTRTNLINQRQDTKTTIMTTTRRPTATTYGYAGESHDDDSSAADISRTHLFTIVAALIAALFIILMLALGIRLTKARIKLKDITTNHRVNRDLSLPSIPMYAQAIASLDRSSNLTVSSITDPTRPYERVAPLLPLRAHPPEQTTQEDGYMVMNQVRTGQEVPLLLHHYQNTREIFVA